MELAHPAISVRRQCELLGVNRSGLYYQPLGESAENLKLMRFIDEEYTRHPFCGSRRLMRWLHDQGCAVGRHRVRRLMGLMGLEAVYPKPKLSQPGEGHEIYPYLLNGVTVTRVNQVWSTDITYIRMAEGFVYLVVMDWFSRSVLSWALSLTMEIDFCLEALDQALRRGQPEIFNSDQARSSPRDRFTGVLAKRGIAISMYGRGRCVDNIFIERLWRSLKYEEVYLRDYARVLDARTGIGNWFGYYNHERHHQGLGYHTPATVYGQGWSADQKEQERSELGGAAPKPSGFIALRPEWLVLLVLQWKALERRIGQRRDATRAPAQVPEWQGRLRPPRTISDSPVSSLLQAKFGLDNRDHRNYLAYGICREELVKNARVLCDR